jgi:extracellular factor (EF) 3-hydroxypalmitic acid methyl ester biosynthesis protein
VERHHAFEVWLGDLEAYLSAAREDSIRREERRCAEDEILGRLAPCLVARMNRASADLHALDPHLPAAERPRLQRLCREVLGRFFAASPFMHRATTKPLGYAGDYEMMNMLYRDHEEGATPFGRAMNRYATQEAAARATINRIDLLVGLLCDEIEGRGRSRLSPYLRIASVGCGPAFEVQQLLTRYPGLGSAVDITLIDQEEEAIAQCEGVIGPLATRTGAKLTTVRQSLRTLIAADARLEDYDLVYSAGLFDYLSDRVFRSVLRFLYDALAPGGRLAVGNFAAGNPSRQAMEYFSDWVLIHRTREDLLAFADDLRPTPSSVAVVSEPLGVNLFLTVRK